MTIQQQVEALRHKSPTERIAALREYMEERLVACKRLGYKVAVIELEKQLWWLGELFPPDLEAEPGLAPIPIITEEPKPVVFIRSAGNAGKAQENPSEERR